jgi:hypothetical protein
MPLPIMAGDKCMNEQDKILAAISNATNAQMIAITLLVQMLERRGVMEKGAYLQAIKNTFNAPEADFNRLDYKLLQNLVNMLESSDGTIR